MRVGSTLSEAHNQEQGSILSVTLFSLKINNIVKCLNPGVDCSLYVDDFLLLISIQKYEYYRSPTSIKS